MRTGKPGISSFDKFAMGQAIRSELRTLGGNLFGLNSAIMKLSNGDDFSRATLDPTIGARTVHKVSARQIGKTVSSNSGGLGPTSTPARTANLLGNPYMRRYEGPYANGRFNFGLPGAPSIGEYYDVYESENHRVRFMDDTIGRDLLGYTHLIDAAKERTGDETADKLYMRSTYGLFNNMYYPYDEEEVERLLLGPQRYSPSKPYALKPLENPLVRRTMNGDVQTFQDNFEAVLPGRPPYMGSLINVWDFMGSSYYLNLLNGVAEHGLYVENYEYEQRNRVIAYDRDDIPQSDYPYFLDVDTMSPTKEINGLLGKTNRMFYEGKIKSLVNRFATLNGNGEGMPGFLNTATDHLYGLSRGRNLRKLDLTNENGYPNPYCRVWTTHYQYAKYKNLIRGKWADDTENMGDNHYTLTDNDQLMRPNKGYNRLKRMTSIDPMNGRPIFAPYYVNNRDQMEKDSIKRCMFSIENLAWKDIIPDSVNIRKDNDFTPIASSTTIQDNGTLVTTASFNARGFGQTLTKEQRGPNGGRIMWFPPYNLKFNEQAHTNWNSHDFIGRGEKIYTYINAERTGTLSFTLLIDHPSIINEWARGGKQGKTANKTSPLSKDEMILRYFAGCDALEFNPREEYDVPYEKIATVGGQIVTETKKDEPAPGDEDRPVKEETPELNGDITFYSIFYYPNDYSAEDFNKGEKAIGGQRFDAGLAEMFEKGQRSNGTVGYELQRAGEHSSTGMTYNDKPYVTAVDKNGKTVRWLYPVDTRVQDEVLINSERYKDTQDFGLNGKFYGNFWGAQEVKNLTEKSIIEYLNNGNTGMPDINDEDEELKIAKSLVGLSGTENKYLIPAYNFYKSLSTVVTKLNANGNYKYDIDIKGFASVHGYGNEGLLKPMYATDITGEKQEIVQKEKGVKSNEILAENRAAVLEGWMRNLGVFDFDGKDIINHNGNGQIDNSNAKTESDFRPKAARAAVVTFKITADKTNITEAQKNADVEVVIEKSATTVQSAATYQEIYSTGNTLKYENQTYDNEYTYFKQINENDDMVKRYISDKVDYFDPAFHSITPEGFNARLTFLQQCTRQGPTISTSDLGRGSSYGAGNLAFGRAPFCVLRIGDFYNTKICIQSINIDYDNGGGIQWDLNPEGVGLQPMLANITINFTFLGGSDLSGPIARLQNAAFYNFYANTSVYDRRADYRDDFVTPEEDTAKSWSPNLLNKEINRNITEHIDFYTRKPSERTDKNQN